jgi:hypothetical protein
MDESLPEKLSAVQKSLAEITKSIKHQRRALSRRRKLPPQALLAGRILASQSECERVLRQFLVWKTKADATDVDRWVADILGWRRDVSKETLDRHAKSVDTPSQRAAAACVKRFLAENSLHEWVQTQNLSKGIAPVTGVILQDLHKHGLQGPGRVTDEHERKYKSSLQFLRRWRKRWGVRHGTIPVGDELEPAELLAKARVDGGNSFGFVQRPGMGHLRVSLRRVIMLKHLEPIVKSARRSTGALTVGPGPGRPCLHAEPRFAAKVPAEPQNGHVR